MRLLSIVLFLVVFGFSCSEKEKTKEEIIVGKWEALWETDPATYPDLKDEKVFTMNGYLVFKEDGSLNINAFGFPECIFSSDTMSHDLSWQISSDTISFISGNDPYGIPYRIKRISEEEVLLTLMEDISLKLTRQH
jgi:hypothetical protein